MNRKILTIATLIVVVVICACMFIGCTPKGKNIFSNSSEGVFEYKNLDELKSEWTLETASSATENNKTVFVMNYDEKDNDYSVKIDTNDVGWGSIGQKVKLSAGCYYRVNYTITISSMSAYTTGKAYDGVFITIDEDDDFNYKEGDLMHTEAVTETEYAVTFKAKSTSDATIKLAVGTEKYPVDAIVTITNFSLERITKADAVSNFAGIYATDHYGEATDFNALYIVLGAFMVALIGYFAYFAFQRHIYKEEKDSYQSGILFKLKNSKVMGYVTVVIIGLVVTLITDIISTVVSSGFAYTNLGYNVEGLSSQALFIANYGPQNLIKSLSAFCTDNGYTYTAVSAMPLQLYFLGFVGLFGRIFEGIGAQYLATIFFLRFFTALANIGTALVLYSIMKKSIGNIGATLMASAYTLLPTVFATGALWGYTESITALLIVVTVAFMLKNNYVGTAIAFFVACMFSTSALFLAPIVLFYTILQCIRNVKNIIPASIILILSFFVYYALCVPFDINSINDGTTFACFNRAWAELYTSVVYTMNAFNFQGILGNNFAQLSTASLVVTIVFIVFILLLVGLAYFKFKNRMNLVLLATVFINLLFVFGNNMQPISMYISLALMLLYAVMNKEKRVYFAFVVFAILTFINVAYLELFVGYTSTAINHMSANALTYVFGVLELLAVLYYVYITYDIVVTRKVAKIKPMAFTYGEYLENLGKRIKKGYYKLLIKLQRKA